jgi:hypothetical protein
LYVFCSFNTTIDVPSFGIPTPTNGAPPPAKLEPDSLAIPAAEPSVLFEPVGVEPVPELSVPVAAPPAAGVPALGVPALEAPAPLVLL